MDFETIKRFGLNNYNIDIEKSFDYYDPIQNNHTINIFLKKDNHQKCPKCNSYNVQIIGSRKNKIKHACISQKNIIVLLTRRKYKCSDCNSIFTEYNPISNKSIESKYLEIEILNSLRDIKKTYKDVATSYGVSEYYVRDLFDRLVDIKRNKLPEVLCIDEVYNKKLTKHKYCCILYSPQRKEITDVLNTRHKNYLEAYFSRIPISERQKVSYISIDLWESYRDVGYSCFPNALICADPFHVVKNIVDAFDDVRIRIQNKYKDTKEEKIFSYYWILKKYNFLLISTKKRDYFSPKYINHCHMIMTASDLINHMLKISDELKIAYKLLSDYQLFNKHATLDEAERWLDELIHNFKSSGINEYESVWKMLVNWRVEIVNSFNRINGHRISNGAIERVNEDIKTLYRISFGSRNFTRTRNRIMFSINTNAPVLGRKKDTNNNYHIIKKR